MEKTTMYAIGAAVCSAVASAAITWFITDKRAKAKYEKIAKEEIDSVKERFTVPKKPKTSDQVDNFIKSKSLNGVPVDSLKNAANKPSLNEYAKKIKSYTNYSNVEYEPERTVEVPDEKKPHVITPDEFGENSEYDQQELTLYADGILADEDDTILDADEVVGVGSLDHVGDYEDDAVHIKNDFRKIYYEVLVDNRSYKEATGKDPHQSKDEED